MSFQDYVKAEKELAKRLRKLAGVRQSGNELEERLINEDTISTGKTVEVPKNIKDDLGYSGVVSFEYVFQKAILVSSDDPSNMCQTANGGVGLFDPDGYYDGFFRTDVIGRVESLFKVKFGDRLFGIIFRDINPEYEQFNSPIELPEPKFNLDICVGKVSAEVTGHAFYKA